MRPGGPTARALGLAAAGVAALVASRGFGTQALAVLGAGMVALPVLMTGIVWLAAAGVTVERAIRPARCVAGSEARVAVRVDGWVTRLGLDRLLDVGVDPGLGDAAPESRPTRGGWVVVARRGDHRLPPARVTISDPFGLARRTRAGTGDERLLVVPFAPTLASAPIGTRSRGQGARRRPVDTGFGELDRIRDYQAGDALSRVHWGQTAKRGRLQTKEMRAPAGSGRTVLLLLDGAVPGGADFETTVTAAAALARHLDGRREPVSLAHTGLVPARVAALRGGWPVMEIALARAEPGGSRSLAMAMRAEATAPDPPDLIVALTCGAEAGLVAAAAQARGLGVAVAAVLAGPAAAAATELTAAGVDVVLVSRPDRVAAALSRPQEAARVS